MTVLKSTRKARGLTQDDLAELLGCKQSTISDIERGYRTPSLPLAVKIERELGIPASVWAPEARKCA